MAAYDLHAPGRDYDDIAGLLKSARNWAHPQGSVWWLDTGREPEWWVDELRKRGDANDEYFVVRMRQNWAGWNCGQKMYDWLNQPSRSW
jgi:hypothetical protein